MRKANTMMDSFAQWWFGVDIKPKRRIRRKKRVKTNK